MILPVYDMGFYAADWLPRILYSIKPAFEDRKCDQILPFGITTQLSVALACLKKGTLGDINLDFEKRIDIHLRLCDAMKAVGGIEAMGMSPSEVRQSLLEEHRKIRSLTVGELGVIHGCFPKQLLSEHAWSRNELPVTSPGPMMTYGTICHLSGSAAITIAYDVA